MRKPRYLLYCAVAVFTGCVLGAVWYDLAMSASDPGYHPFTLLPLLVFDSLLFAWLPPLLFGAVLHHLMQRLCWTKGWQWVLAGTILAWCLFRLGASIPDWNLPPLDYLLFGVKLIWNLSGHSWPAALCGALVSAVLYFVASKFAPIATPVGTS